MRALLFIVFLIISIQLLAQEKYLFDTTRIDSTTKLIGRYPQYDKQKTYKQYNFIITDPEIIKSIVTEMSLEDEAENVIEDPDFRITIIQNFKEVKTWIISPGLKNVRANGSSYKFDISILEKLASKYPFDYKFTKVPFKNKLDYEQYLNKQKKDTTYLFDYAPDFKFEGSFEITFPRNEKFSSQKAVRDYLTPLIDKIAIKEEYQIIYFPNLKSNDQTQYTITIEGSKRIFDKLQLGNGKKQNWKATLKEAWFFYRTK